jgi:hypothetical protein
MTPPDDSDTAEIYVEVCKCRGPIFLEARRCILCDALQMSDSNILFFVPCPRL